MVACEGLIGAKYKFQWRENSACHCGFCKLICISQGVLAEVPLRTLCSDVIIEGLLVLSGELFKGHFVLKILCSRIYSLLCSVLFWFLPPLVFLFLLVSLSHSFSFMLC